ncbi:hypothetical protein BUE80_DR004587 [Diplocarpon rosae]|nr:hypothetical protein BUE80_DR004587 [Diplocarpon rosae]
MVFDSVMSLAKGKAATWKSGQPRNCDLFAKVVESPLTPPINIDSQEGWADEVGGGVTGVRDESNSFGITFRYRERSTINNRCPRVVDNSNFNGSMYGARSKRLGIDAFHPLVTPARLPNFNYASSASSTMVNVSHEDRTRMVYEDKTSKPSRFCTVQEDCTPAIQDQDADEADNITPNAPFETSSILERGSTSHILPRCQNIFEHDSGFTAAALAPLPRQKLFDLDYQCAFGKQFDWKAAARDKEEEDEQKMAQGTQEWVVYGGTVYPQGKDSSGADARWNMNKGRPPLKGDIYSAPTLAQGELELEKKRENKEVTVKDTKGKGVDKESQQNRTEGGLTVNWKSSKSHVTDPVISNASATAEVQPINYYRIPLFPKSVSDSPHSILSSSIKQAKTNPDFKYVSVQSPLPETKPNNNFDFSVLSAYAAYAAPTVPHKHHIRKRGVAPEDCRVRFADTRELPAIKPGNEKRVSREDKALRNVDIGEKCQSADERCSEWVSISNSGSTSKENSMLQKKQVQVQQKPVRFPKSKHHKYLRVKGPHSTKIKITDYRKISGFVHTLATIAEETEEEDEHERNSRWMLELAGYAA